VVTGRDKFRYRHSSNYTKIRTIFFTLDAISLSLSANNTMRSRLNSQLIISLALKLSKEQKNQIQSYDRGFEVALEFTTITHPGKIRDSSPLWSVLPFGFFPLS